MFELASSLHIALVVICGGSVSANCALLQRRLAIGDAGAPLAVAL